MSFGLYVGNSNGTKLSLSNSSLFLAVNSLFETLLVCFSLIFWCVNSWSVNWWLGLLETLQFIELATQNSFQKYKIFKLGKLASRHWSMVPQHYLIGAALFLANMYFSSLFHWILARFWLFGFTSNFLYFVLKTTSKQVKFNINSLNLREYKALFKRFSPPQT